jgi:hypothetical protein
MPLALTHRALIARRRAPRFDEHGETMMMAPPSGHDSYWATAVFARSQAFVPDLVVLLLFHPLAGRVRR